MSENTGNVFPLPRKSSTQFVSREAEQSVLGGLMFGKNASLCFSIFTDMNEDDFFCYEHPPIFRALKLLFASNRPCDPVSVAVQLDEIGEKVDSSYLGLLAGNTTSPKNIIAYSVIVLTKSCERKLKEGRKQNWSLQTLLVIENKLHALQERTDYCNLDISKMGKVKVHLGNLEQLLSKHASFKEQLRYNEFSQMIEYNGNPFSKDAATEIQLEVRKLVNVQWNVENVYAICRFVAMKHNAYNPLADWLNTLEWDGEYRIGNLFHQFMGAEDNDVNMLFGVNFLIGAVARALNPGCRMDWMPIFEGVQGIGKSTILEVLFGEDYFSDSKLTDLHKPDSKMLLRGKWCIEFSDLGSLPNNTADDIKSFLSQKVDYYRAPYDREPQEHSRTCVFVGTTNKTQYLRDATGNRRFAPVACGTIDVEGLRNIREQLWAEAVHCFLKGEPWHLPFENKKIQELQASRYERDSWEEALEEFLDNMESGRVHSQDLREVCFGSHTPTKKQNAALVEKMRQMGWNGPKGVKIAGLTKKGYTKI